MDEIVIALLSPLLRHIRNAAKMLERVWEWEKYTSHFGVWHWEEPLLCLALLEFVQVLWLCFNEEWNERILIVISGGGCGNDWYEMEMDYSWKCGNWRSAVVEVVARNRWRQGTWMVFKLFFWIKYSHIIKMVWQILVRMLNEDKNQNNVQMRSKLGWWCQSEGVTHFPELSQP